jgi:drug/metabolite transporter (DMT)-like permease
MPSPDSPTPALSQLHKGVALGIASSFLGSTGALASKHLTATLHISTIVLAQYLFCILLTLPWLLRHGRRGLATQYPWTHLIRGLSGCGCFYAFYAALRHIPLVDATLLRNTAPLMVPLVLLVWYGVKVPRANWLPLMIGFVGIVLILKPGVNGLGIWSLVALASGIGLAISMVSTRTLARQEPESRILFYYFVTSLLLAVPFFALNPEPIPLAAVPELLYIGGGMYVAFVLYTRAYSYVSASVLSPTNYFGVVFAGFFDWLLWQHVPDLAGLLGIALVIGGGILVLRMGQEEPEAETEQPQ